jgi:hypothetical protein
MNDKDIAALSAAEKLALAQRLLGALAADMGLAVNDKKPLSSAELSALQATLATQVHSALKADPAATNWNAVREQVLNRGQ